ISQPQLLEMGLPYLPVMWGVLKTYWERYGPGSDGLEWLPPLNDPGEASALMAPYIDTRIDVLGLSCYVWNWKVQCRIAREVKARYPNSLVVAGGPEPDYKDPAFFKKHPYIDIVAVKDGEITFNNILKRVLEYDTRDLVADKSAFLDIPGLYMAGNEETGHVCTGPAAVPTEFIYSPYIDQTAHYEAFRNTIPSDVIAVWETNRGCPYSCSYCDWGSSTMSKIRQFDMDRVRAEADWFGRLRVGFIMLADANFGILPRDLEIADTVNTANRQYQYPKFFSYNTAKNNPGRALSIAKKFLSSGLMSTHILSVQHTSQEVLAATDRANISTKKQYEVARQLMEDGIQVYVQLILGIPGDRNELWRACFSDLMEWGIHSYYWIYPYHLLPNAPAAEPAYMKKWEIETLERYALINHGARPSGPIDNQTQTKVPIIVRTKTYSQDDWVEMNVYASCIKALHNTSTTQLIAIYLRFTHDVTYEAFYGDLYDNFIGQAPMTKDWCDAVRRHFREYLEDEAALTFMDLDQLPEFGYQVESSRWLYFQMCFNIDRFFDELKGYLIQRYPGVPNLESAVEYQKNLIVLPGYDRRVGKTLITDFDWMDYFEQARRLVSYSPLPEPAPMPGSEIRISDQAWSDDGTSLDLDWGSGDDNSKWERWVHAMTLGRNSYYKNNFQKLEIQPALAAGRPHSAALPVYAQAKDGAVH
ncbi:MAG TPA: radical SAM protein, partial [Blastocatellia bacterium]|nr:radical SAM protein [Blastocatellia bacterium]